MIYTIGSRNVYEKAMRDSYPNPLLKVGRNDGYEGGYAFETHQQASDYIKEIDMQDVWTVFGLDAEISDTEMHKSGKYRNLLRDAKIIFLNE